MNIIKLQKWGNSQGIRIPKPILSIANFKEDDEVEIIAEKDRIIILHPKKELKKYDIEKLFEGYQDDMKLSEEWDAPKGKEIW